MEQNMVSIITPVYNSGGFLQAAMDCVAEQSYQNWEMLLVDDCSTDNSAELMRRMARRDNRFRPYRLEENSGAAVARNLALREACGRFIAYLDADDLWKREKLARQIRFMLEHRIAFCCTDYEVIDEAGLPKHKRVTMPKRIDYNLFLRNTIIQTVGVMVDTALTGKDLIEMPNLRRRQDAATWCKLLKQGFDCRGLNESLAYYRRVSGSLSSNKLQAVRGTWFLYRRIERLPLAKACRCFAGYAYHACKKRIYVHPKSGEV